MIIPLPHTKRNHIETHFDFQAGTEPVVMPNKHRPHYGIYAGSFDPVHAGHIVFALKSQKAANLDHVYFVAERKPAHGTQPEHYAHRNAMLQRALQPYDQFSVFDIPDARLNSRSITRLYEALPDGDFSLLTTAGELLWPNNDELPALYRRLPLVVAVTSHEQMAEVLSRFTRSDSELGNITFVDIGTDHISSAEVRKGIRMGKQVRGVLPSVWRYARKQWLYIPTLHR